MKSRILEISAVKSNSKYYSCKTCINRIDDNNARLSVIKIEEITNLSSDRNSFTKLKVIFDSNEEKLNRVQFRDILVELTKHLGKKHKISNFILVI